MHTWKVEGSREQFGADCEADLRSHLAQATSSDLTGFHEDLVESGANKCSIMATLPLGAVLRVLIWPFLKQKLPHLLLSWKLHLCQQMKRPMAPNG